MVSGQWSVVSGKSTIMRCCKVFAGPSHDILTLSVAPRFGNPDLFMTTSYSGYLPTQNSSDWSSEAEGADSIVIRGSDPKACANCLYYEVDARPPVESTPPSTPT